MTVLLKKGFAPRNGLMNVRYVRDLLTLNVAELAVSSRTNIEVTSIRKCSQTMLCFQLTARRNPARAGGHSGPLAQSL
jgi:hypothetical protein